MPKSKSVFTKDGVELPPLPWSDKPEHILAHRENHEDISRGIAAMISLSNFGGLHEDCPKGDCRRRKACMGSRRATSGPKKGLYEAPPYCIAVNREEIRDILQENGLLG